MTQVQPQSPGQPQLQYFDLDFSPGIVADQYSSTGLQGAAPGAARATTFGCFSPPSGGLAPLPRQSLETGYDSWTLTPANITAGTVTRPGYLPAATDAPRGYGRMFLVDARIHGPVAPVDASGGGQHVGDVPVAMYAYLWRPAGDSGGTNYYPYQSFAHKIPTETARVSVRNLVGSSTAPLVVPPGNLDITTAKPSAYLPVVVAVLGAWNKASLFFSEFLTIPNTSTPTNTAPYVDDFTSGGGITGKLPPFWLVTHQGRTIFIIEDQTSYDFTSEGTSVGPERLYYTPYADAHPSTINGPVIVAEENPSGYGSWASLNANELLLIKHRGGAVLIRGDIANPTVIRLPGVTSTYGLHSIGCMVPGLGYVYGSSAGVFAWAGQDESQALSARLSPSFWVSNRNWSAGLQGADARANVGAGSNTNIYGWYGLAGRFAFSDPFVFAPNNWMMDARSGAWWHLVNTTTASPLITHWDISARSRKVYGFFEYIDDASTDVFATYNLNLGAAAYTYESQPIIVNRGRRTEVRELLVSLIGENAGTLTITLTNEVGATQAETITLTSSAITVTRIQTTLTASTVQVTLASASNSSIIAAPRVIAFSFGVEPLTLL